VHRRQDAAQALPLQDVAQAQAQEQVLVRVRWVTETAPS